MDRYVLSCICYMALGICSLHFVVHLKVKKKRKKSFLPSQSLLHIVKYSSN